MTCYPTEVRTITNSANLGNKIPEIESVRALAITMVLAFHFFARWSTPIYPFDIYPHKLEIIREISQFGYMGVQLFFMVSGFVILSSLENQVSFKTFAIARVKRIYPGLFVAIPIVYVVCNLLNQSFIAPVPISSLLPSLTLVGPDFLNFWFATNFTWTTGVLWSLFVEIQFYLIAGFLYFVSQKFTFVTKLFVFAISIQFIKIILSISNTDAKNALDALLPINNYIWWFLAGSIFWKIRNSQDSGKLRIILFFSICFILVSSNFESSQFRFSLIPSLLTILFFILFLFIAQNSKKVRFLKVSPIVWLGGLSYEFYLIHESIGVSMISKINEATNYQISLAMYLILLMALILLLIALSALLKVLSSRFLRLITKTFNSHKGMRGIVVEK